MKVVVQRMSKKVFLQPAGEWTASRSEARLFPTVLEAIMFCIGCEIRDVLLVAETDAGGEQYFYPFGGDPVVKAEQRKLRRLVRESRRLKAERRLIRARIDLVLAEQKEKKKQFPFKRTQVAQSED